MKFAGTIIKTHVAQVVAQTLASGQLQIVDDVEMVPPKLVDFDPAVPPRRLSNEPTHPDFRPDFMRVGLRIDGVERSNVSWYDADSNVYRTIGKGAHLQSATSIEPYWRQPETRQNRRLMKRWLEKHKR